MFLSELFGMTSHMEGNGKLYKLAYGIGLCYERSIMYHTTEDTKCTNVQYVQDKLCRTE